MQHEYPFTRYFEDNACPHCEGGSVDLRIGSEVVETIICSTCNGQGWLIPNERAKVMLGVRAMSAAITDADKL